MSAAVRKLSRKKSAQCAPSAVVFRPLKAYSREGPAGAERNLYDPVYLSRQVTGADVPSGQHAVHYSIGYVKLDGTADHPTPRPVAARTVHATSSRSLLSINHS